MPKENPRTVGQFAWDTTFDQWYWDAGLHELHGYRPGAVALSTDLVLEHKQDEHRAHASTVLELSATTDQTFSNYHGIVDVTGRRRTVLSVGRSRLGESRYGAPHRFSRGFMIDVTDDESATTQRALASIRSTEAPIQQSLGLLMGSIGLSEQQALTVMMRMSSHHNVKVRDLARRFVHAAVSSAAETPRDLSQLLVTEATALAIERTRMAHNQLGPGSRTNRAQG